MRTDLNANIAAALRAHDDSVRKDSVSVLEQIIGKEADTGIGKAARQRLADLENDAGLLGKFFKS